MIVCITIYLVLTKGKNCRESVNSIDARINAWLLFSWDHLHKSSCPM